jgi:hypothetical protein
MANMRKPSVVLILALVLAACAAVVATAGAEPDPGSGSKPPEPSSGSGVQGSTKSYPECTPYLSETAATFCRFGTMHVEFDGSCSFSYRTGNCAGHADKGSFPWGTSGSAKDPYVLVFWQPAGSGDGRKVVLRSYGPVYSRIPSAELTGYVPAGGSPELVVYSAIAGNDQGFPKGDEYLTPNLPGRGYGQPGGPLYINWQAHGIQRAEVTIEGYLYLVGH